MISLKELWSLILNRLTIKGNAARTAIRLLIIGYLLLCFICFVLLYLPFSRYEELTSIQILFYAISIVSTTGLAPTNFAEDFTTLGHFFSLFFIQIGGIGYMAISGFIILSCRRRMDTLSLRLLKLDFNLPDEYPTFTFIYSVVIFTLLIEACGALILYLGFQNAGVEDPLWMALFHSISTFCTAGFSLFENSLGDFSSSPLILYTSAIISLLGSLGFIVLLDGWLRLIRHQPRMTQTS